MASLAIALQREVRAARSAATSGYRAYHRYKAGNLPSDEREARTGRPCTGYLRPDNPNNASACKANGNLIYISTVEILLRDLPRIPQERMLAESATGARMERTNVGIESRYMSWQPANDFHRGVPPL